MYALSLSLIGVSVGFLTEPFLGSLAVGCLLWIDQFLSSTIRLVMGLRRRGDVHHR